MATEWIDAEAELTDSILVCFSARKGSRYAMIVLWNQRTDSELVRIELPAETLVEVATEWLRGRGHSALPPEDEE